MNKYGGGNNTQSRDNLLIFFENYKRVLDSLNKEEATIKQKNIGSLSVDHCLYTKGIERVLSFPTLSATVSSKR